MKRWFLSGIKYNNCKIAKVSPYDTIYEIEFYANPSTYDSETENIYVQPPIVYFMVINPYLGFEESMVISDTSYLALEEQGIEPESPEGGWSPLDFSDKERCEIAEKILVSADYKQYTNCFDEDDLHYEYIYKNLLDNVNIKYGDFLADKIVEFCDEI